jgi:hypothetical protein
LDSNQLCFACVRPQDPGVPGEGGCRDCSSVMAGCRTHVLPVKFHDTHADINSLRLRHMGYGVVDTDPSGVRSLSWGQPLTRSTIGFGQAVRNHLTSSWGNHSPLAPGCLGHGWRIKVSPLTRQQVRTGRRAVKMRLHVLTPDGWSRHHTSCTSLGPGSGVEPDACEDTRWAPLREPRVHPVESFWLQLLRLARDRPSVPGKILPRPSCRPGNDARF